jgi:hypothetical protein
MINRKTSRRHIAVVGMSAYAVTAQSPAANMSFFVTSANAKGGNLGGPGGSGSGLPGAGEAGGRRQQDVARVPEHEHR